MDKIDRIIREEVRRELLRAERVDEASKKEWAAAIAAGLAVGGSFYHAYKHPRVHQQEEPQQIEVMDDRYEDEKADNLDDSYLMRFINHSENGDSIGYDRENHRWYAPSSKNHDSYQYGMGTDIRHNGAWKLLKTDSKGRKYMTVDDERELRHANLQKFIKSFDQRLSYAKKVTGEPDFRPSETKRAMTISAIYCKGGQTVANEMFTPENCQVFVYGTDQEWKEIVDRFYKKHNVSSRSGREQKFIEDNAV